MDNEHDHQKNPTVGELIAELEKHPRDHHVAIALPSTPQARAHMDVGFAPHLYVFEDLYAQTGDHEFVVELPDTVLVPLEDVEFVETITDPEMFNDPKDGQQ